MTLEEAKKHARNNGCLIVTKPDYFLLYRECKPRNVCIGRRKGEKNIVDLVKKACRSS